MKHSVKHLLSLILAALTIGHAAHADQLGVEVTVTNLANGQSVSGNHQATIYGSGGMFSFSQAVPGGGSLFVTANLTELAGSNMALYEDQMLTVTNSSPNLIGLQLKFKHITSEPLAQPVVGGDIHIASNSIYEYDDTIAALHTDGEVVAGSELTLLNFTSCGRNCFTSMFNNGTPSIPANSIEQSYGFTRSVTLTSFAAEVVLVNFRANDSAICPDFTGDGLVNSADLSFLLGGYGGTIDALDLNQDGTVNGADLGVLLGSYGSCN